MARALQKLSARHAIFVVEYIATLNSMQAAIKAGYSAKTASVTGSRLLATAKIKEEIEKARSRQMVRADFDQNLVLSELWQLASSDVTNYAIDDAGNLVPAPGRPPSVMRAVSSIKRRVRVSPDGTVDREVEFRLWDKPGSLKLAGRHVGLFPVKDQAAIEAQATAVVERLIAKARQEKEAAKTLAEQQEAERARAIDVAEVPKAVSGGRTD